MKTIQSLLILLSIIGFGNDSYGQEPLYPYKHGVKYGFCTKNKKMVIPAVYKRIDYSGNFYFADDSTDRTFVFDKNGLAVDSAADVYKVGNDRALFVSPYDDSARRKMIAGIYNRRYPEWELFSPSGAWVIDSTGNKTLLSDTVIAVSNEHLWLRLRSGKKQGVFDVAKNAFVVPMTDDSLHIVPGKFIVTHGSAGCKAYTNKGRVFEVPREACNLGGIYNAGKYFETDFLPGRRKNLYDSKGRIVMPADKYWNIIVNDDSGVIGFYVYTNGSAGVQQSYEIYNAEGVFSKRCFYLEPGVGNCLLISKYDSVNPGVPKKYLYDVVKNEERLMDVADPSGRNERPVFEFVKKDHQFITVYKNGHTTFFSGYTGEQLFSLPDSLNSNGRRQNRGTLGEKISFSRHRYSFVRERTEAPLTILDDKLRVVSREYDSIVMYPNSFHKVYAVKKGTKWGLVNSSINEIVAPEYDRFEYASANVFQYNEYPSNGHYLHVTKNDKSFWIDTTGEVLFGGVNYSYISGYPVNGNWLALSYQEIPQSWGSYKVIDEVLLIAGNGKTIAKWPRRDTLGSVFYAPTVNGKILRYSNSGTQLFDPETGGVIELRFVVTKAVTFQKGAILIICEDSRGRTGVFSALDLTPVVPFGNYRSDVNVTEIANSGMGREDGVTIEILDKWGDERDYASHLRHTFMWEQFHGGFYSVSGVKFWDD